MHAFMHLTRSCRMSVCLSVCMYVCDTILPYACMYVCMSVCTILPWNISCMAWISDGITLRFGSAAYSRHTARPFYYLNTQHTRISAYIQTQDTLGIRLAHSVALSLIPLHWVLLYLSIKIHNIDACIEMQDTLGMWLAQTPGKQQGIWLAQTPGKESRRLRYASSI
jgi:hypothetical protein